MISLFKVKIGISHVNIEETICNFSFISMDDFYNKTEILQQFSDPHQNQFAFFHLIRPSLIHIDPRKYNLTQSDPI